MGSRYQDTERRWRGCRGGRRQSPGRSKEQILAQNTSQDVCNNNQIAKIDIFIAKVSKLWSNTIHIIQEGSGRLLKQQRSAAAPKEARGPFEGTERNFGFFLFL